MCTYVFLQVPRRLEGLGALIHGTFVWFLAGVDPDVRFESVAGGEGPRAAVQVTLEGAVTCVRALMDL